MNLDISRSNSVFGKGFQLFLIFFQVVTSEQFWCRIHSGNGFVSRHGSDGRMKTQTFYNLFNRHII